MSYVKQRESMSSVPLIASLLVQIVASVYSSLVLPSSIIHFVVIIAPIILTVPMVWISIAESFPMVCIAFLSISSTITFDFSSFRLVFFGDNRECQQAFQWHLFFAANGSCFDNSNCRLHKSIGHVHVCIDNRSSGQQWPFLQCD